MIFLIKEIWKIKSKFLVIWSMRKWSYKYVKWRFVTAYPNGWKYALMHPFIFINDFWKYLNWCQEIDFDMNNYESNNEN